MQGLFGGDGQQQVDSGRLDIVMRLLKRIMSNVCSGNTSYERLRRDASVYRTWLDGTAAEQWLMERHWIVDPGDERVLLWKGDQESGRRALLELVCGGEDRTRVAGTMVDPVVKSRVKEVVVMLCTKGLWFFKCVFRFSAVDFARGASYLGDPEVSIASVEAALVELIDTGELEAVVPGKLFYVVQPRLGPQLNFCYEYE